MENLIEQLTKSDFTVNFIEDLGKSQVYGFEGNGKKGKIEVSLTEIPFRAVSDIVDVVHHNISRDELIDIYAEVLEKSINHV